MLVTNFFHETFSYFLCALGWCLLHVLFKLVAELLAFERDIFVSACRRGFKSVLEILPSRFFFFVHRLIIRPFLVMCKVLIYTVGIYVAWMSAWFAGI